LPQTSKILSKPIAVTSFAKLIDDKTKALFVESITNPKYIVPNLPELAKLAHDNNIPLIVDNTFGCGSFFVFEACCQNAQYQCDVSGLPHQAN
jgi:O-acetylhomoserine/O-acetylserine sulfhydrylase-like pyridoxal-dependent enzyme